MEQNKESPCCTDCCEHCMYVESGDFYCEVIQDITINDWTPMICPCPNEAIVFYPKHKKKKE